MKIIQVDIFILKPGCGTMPPAPYKPVIIKLLTDDGVYGYGEAGVALGVGERTVFAMTQDLAPMLLGKDPFDNEVIWERIRTDLNGHISGGGVVVFSAMSAFDMAMMDIKAKSLNVPVYKLLGGKFRESLHCYASQLQCGFGDNLRPLGRAEEYAYICAEAINDGFDTVKINFVSFDREGKQIPQDAVSGPLNWEIYSLVEERLKAIRAECGENLGIIFENFCSMNIASALKMDELTHKYNVLFCEETLLPMKRDLFAPLAKRIRTPLATGEKIHTRWQFSDLFEDRSVDIIQPDPSNCGGISETKKICDMAHIYNIKAQMHLAGSPISTAAAIHLEAAIPNFYIHEYFFLNRHPDYAAYCTNDYQPVNGVLTVPELPGLGQELSAQAINEAVAHAKIC